MPFCEKVFPPRLSSDSQTGSCAFAVISNPRHMYSASIAWLVIEGTVNGVGCIAISAPENPGSYVVGEKGSTPPWVFEDIAEESMATGMG